MRRWLLWLLALFCVLIGALFSAVNTQAVAVDLYFAAPSMPAGIMILLSVLIGALLAGGLLFAAVIVPLRVRLARAQRDRATSGA